jgi:LPXTG-site transpeptidase (sortase) family protein
MLLLSACGSSQQAAAPSRAPVIAATTAAAPATIAATAPAALGLNEGHVPEPSPTALAEAAMIAAPPTAEATSAATAQMLLPPATEAPTSAAPPTAAPTAQQPAPTPAPAPQVARVSKASLPSRLEIKAIGVNQPLVSVGLDKNQEPIVPRHNVGWYNLSAAPGQNENIVLWGHVLPFRSEPNIAPPFARLKELKVGASVVLYDKAGDAHNYVVTKQVWVTPDQVEYILPVGKERVTMVSCIGDKVITNGSVVDMTHRLITIAEPAS